MPSPFVATRNFGYGPDITMVVDPQFATAAPKEVAVADFNGDGKLDVLITTVQVPNSTAVPVRLMLGDGAGGFTDGTAAVFGASPPVVMFARQILTADFNGDSRPDVYVSDHGSDAPPFPGFQNALILSSGATAFANATATLPQVSDFSHSAAFADIEGDGDLDIFVANLGGSSPYFLINDGHGGFTRDATRIPASSFATGMSPSTVLLFDANGDGRPDLMLGDVRSTSGSTILLNDGTGHFNTTLTVVPDLGITAPADAYDIHALDLNGDGRLDLIVLYDVNDTEGRLQVLINRPDGTFVDETVSRMAEPLNSATALRVQVVDLNGDGLPDLYINANSDRPVYLNAGAGHFVRMPVGFVPGNSADNSTVADVNGDGRMDLVTVHNATTLSVRLGLDPGLLQTGTDAADGFMGGPVAETFSGLAGDDVIFTGGGNDSVTAGAGNDTVVAGPGHTYLRGDDGNDSLEGGSGFDDINGNKGDDSIDGGSGGSDWLVGGQGNDVITAHSGQNLIYGNLGDDTLVGGSGGDVLRGGQGNDSIIGGSANEFISGDRGNDTMSGGAGADIFHSSQDAGLDKVLDFHLSEGDRVQLDPGTTYTVSQVGADTVVDMGASSGGAANQMILVGVQMSTLTSGWIFGA